MGTDDTPIMNQYPWTLIHQSSHESTTPTLRWTRAASKKKGDASIVGIEDIWHAIVPEKRSHK